VRRILIWAYLIPRQDASAIPPKSFLRSGSVLAPTRTRSATAWRDCGPTHDGPRTAHPPSARRNYELSEEKNQRGIGSLESSGCASQGLCRSRKMRTRRSRTARRFDVKPFFPSLFRIEQPRLLLAIACAGRAKRGARSVPRWRGKIGWPSAGIEGMSSACAPSLPGATYKSVVLRFERARGHGLELRRAGLVWPACPATAPCSESSRSVTQAARSQ
jgi:hypothetical protein